MTPRNRERPGAAVSAAFLPVILVLFLGSGCAALIYEIVWFQLLELVIGSSAISLGVLLNTDINLRLQYLAGLGLNFYDQDAIHKEMLTWRRPAEDLLVGTERTKRALREAIERRSTPPEQ